MCGSDVIHTDAKENSDWRQAFHLRLDMGDLRASRVGNRYRLCVRQVNSARPPITVIIRNEAVSPRSNAWYTWYVVCAAGRKRHSLAVHTIPCYVGFIVSSLKSFLTILFCSFDFTDRAKLGREKANSAEFADGLTPQEQVLDIS